MKKILTTICAGAMLVALAVPAAAAKAPTFTDVPAKHWAYASVEKAYENGVINGVGLNRFNPAGELKQSEFIAIITRAFYFQEVENQRALAALNHFNPWTDSSDKLAPDLVGPWYNPELEVARLHGLLDGVSDPWDLDRPISRNNMAAIIYGLLKDMKVPMPDAAQMGDMTAKIPDYYAIPKKFLTPVTTVVHFDLIRGMDSAGNFKGDSFTNRAQAAVIYDRLATFLGIGVDVLAPTLEQYGNVQSMMEAVHALTPIYRPGYLTNGQPINAANIKAFMAQVEKKFPDGSRWDKSSTYQYTSPALGEARGSRAFAYMLSDWMFGETAPVAFNQNYNGMRAGDILDANNLDSGEHQWLLSGRDSQQFYGANGDAAGVVSWHSFGGLAPFQQNLNNAGGLSKVITRY